MEVSISEAVQSCSVAFDPCLCCS